jgi:mono/diheme cytochrome c family protein
MALSCALMAGCGGGAGRSEGLDAAALPAGVRPDYAVFAQKCSKCHSLARPLQSGVTDDAFWKEYVERMRRQPSSGISPADEIPILRFLHYFSLEQGRRPGGAGGGG